MITTMPGWPLLFGTLRRWFTGGATELIVNADDFGMSATVNRGIVRAHEHGIVTSVSLMVLREAAGEAAAYGRSHPALSVGLHVDLGEWIYRHGEWQPLRVVVPLEDRGAVGAEIGRQLEAFRALAGRNPTHLDSHQHVHREEAVHSVMRALADELGVPLRHFNDTVHYSGEFYGQGKDGVEMEHAIAVPALAGLVSRLPAGVTELCCHPGDEEQLGEQYGRARPVELEALCDGRVRRALAARGVRLRSFHGLQSPVSGAAPATPSSTVSLP